MTSTTPGSDRAQQHAQEQPQQQPQQQRERRRALTVLVVVVLAAAYTLWVATWPELYMFATDQGASALARLATVPVHLSDDVMVTLRAGQVLLDTGIPALNHTDLAQPSTSYLMPYVFAGLAAALPSNIAVMAYGALGLAAVLFSVGAVVGWSRSLVNGTVLALALVLTETNALYALNGWDHLFQGAAFVAAILLARPGASTTRLAIAGALLAAGSLLRPDGALIAFGVIAAAVLTQRDRRRALIALLTPFAGVVVVFLAVNLAQFGSLLPTTTRLKLGSAPGFQYAWDYFVKNAVGAFTALSVLLLLLLFAVLFHRVLPMRIVGPIALGSSLTAAIAVYNSDTFAGGRMFWVPALALALVLAMWAPPVAGLGEAYQAAGASPTAKRILTGALAALLAIGLAFAAVTGLRGAIVSKEAVTAERTVNQYELAQWANANLDPADGALGVFYAGVAYHLPDFEVADFLGKGDEAIATLPPQQGMPGHNKWDIDTTLDKWNPQAILPTVVIDPTDPAQRDYAERWQAERWNHAYLADLFLDPRVQQDYRLCMVPDIRGVTDVTFGILLRADIAARQAQAADCRSLQ